MEAITIRLEAIATSDKKHQEATIMSGTPAIDTRSQNSFIKQKQSKKKQKAKQTKKQKNVAVRICRFFFTFFSLYFRIVFAFFSLYFRFFSLFS